MVALSRGMPTINEQDIWAETLRSIEADSEGGNLDMWLSQARLLRIEAGVVHVEVLNEFCRDWLRERYVERLRALLARHFDGPVQIELHLAEAPARSSTPAPPPKVRPSQPATAPQAPHPRYTFDHYVIGPSNQLACEAARSIGERLGDATHPLYIYAPSGLGKTHLLSAVANTVALRRPGCRVFYLPTQRFVEEFVHAVRAGGLEAFDRKYREECDLLLLDDVHVLRGKDGTQERFFHIFNALYDRHVPIIMTSDQWPKEIPDLEERLRTRFLWGLLVNIDPPEFETRVAILRRKAEDEGLDVPDDVAQLIALKVTGSVRELEGVLGRLAAQAELSSRPISLALAQEVLNVLLPAAPLSCTIEELQRAVCSLFGIHLSDLRGPSRRHSVTLPRHIAMFLARDALRLPLPTIGERFGNRDHTTVMSACRRVATLLESDAATRNIVLNLRRQLGLP
ncbi:MAG: chromosomal replication initiator protein DnaA [Deltaproteobacteria bacterium]|nr:chromosomal replication initiator protein DnaA [Deltaproteobacteria bacterium]